tara:strand:- start:2470 stop:2643 length:174 start_codon:yes stop_codon:yes gene_type:complete
MTWVLGAFIDVAFAILTNENNADAVAEVRRNVRLDWFIFLKNLISIQSGALRDTILI